MNIWEVLLGISQSLKGPVGWWWPKDRKDIVFTCYTTIDVVRVLIHFL